MTEQVCTHGYGHDDDDGGGHGHAYGDLKKPFEVLGEWRFSQSQRVSQATGKR